MLQLRITPVAINDMQTIREFIAEDNAVKAKETIERLFDKFELLIEFPDLGASLENRVSFKTEYRYIIEGNYIIVYRKNKMFLEIYRIMNRNQDFIKMLAE